MPPPRGTWNPIEGPADYDMTADVHNDTYPAINPTQFDYQGKTVFISGASRGIGFCMAVAYARAGASQIAIGSRSDHSSTVAAMRKAAKEAGRPEPQILSLTMDITDEQSVAAGSKLIETHFGRLDIVINNAGAFTGPGTKVADLALDDWKRNFDVNLHGPFLILRALLPLLLRTEGGKKTIVTVASVGALCSTPRVSGYQTSKLAVLRLTEFAAAEYGDQGLLTYCIHPGNIPSALVGEIPDNLKPIFTETPELSANSLVYLTSERRKWLAGRYVNVTWDLPQLMAKKQEIIDGDKLKVRLVV